MNDEGNYSVFMVLTFSASRGFLYFFVHFPGHSLLLFMALPGKYKEYKERKVSHYFLFHLLLVHKHQSLNYK